MSLNEPGALAGTNSAYGERQGLRERALGGAIWSAAGMAFTFVVQFAVAMALARLLSPRDFGLMAIAALVCNFAMVFGEMGIGMAVVQRRDVSDVQLSSFFALNLLSSSILAGALSLAAPLIAAYFKSPEAAPLVRLSSLGLPLGALGLSHGYLLQKELSFKLYSIAGAIAAVAYGIVGIAAAAIGAGAASLAWAFLAQQGALSTFLWFFCPWRPRLSQMSLKSLSGMLSFGFNLTGERIVGYFGDNIDTAVVGRFLGATSLGFYNMAWKMTMFPASRIPPVVSRVAFPALSIVQENKRKVREAYLQMLRHMALIAFPLLSIVAILAPELILLLYGRGWEPAVVLVQLLAVAGCLRMIGTIVGSVFYSQGRPDLSFRLILLDLGISAALIPLGARWGAEGVAGAVSAFYVIAVFIDFIVVCRLIELELSEVARALLAPSTAALAMSACVAAVRFYGQSLGLAPGPILAAGSFTGVLAYGIAMFLLDRKAASDFAKTAAIAIDSARARSAA